MLVIVRIVARANTDKDNLEAKVRSGSAQETAVKASAAGLLGAAAPPGGTAQTHTVQDLKKRIHELEDEVVS